MTAVLHLARRELRSYLNTLWGLRIMAIILVLDGLLFNTFALGSTARLSADVLEDFFYFSSGTTMIAGILITMRLLAEEALCRLPSIKDGEVITPCGVAQGLVEKRKMDICLVSVVRSGI